MLGPQPSRSADAPPHTPLPNPKSVAAATTEMMWAVALATTRASLASTAHGLALWSRLLRAPIGPFSLIAASPARSSNASTDASLIPIRGAAAPGGSAQETAGGRAPADAPGEVAAFARYRSSGGHAAAQVITHN